MKNTLLKSLSLFGVSLTMALSVAAQDQPKVKINHHETKFKSEDLKVKEQKEETKLKADDLKMKDEKSERKIKAKVRPMQVSSSERTEIKTGETQVRAKEHLAPISVKTEVVTPAVPEPVAAEPVPVPKTAAVVKKAAPRRYAAHKSVALKSTAARKTRVAPKVVVRTKTVRDTVFVASPPERIVSTQTEYIHDTVSVTRVDTVVRMETKNTYAGYNVPRGEFKKVKLKKDKDGEVWMKRKEKDGVKTEKLKREE